MLDPFWFTQKQRGKSDNWKRTLGAEQYEWLKRILEASRAKFRFIFIHHLVGGADDAHDPDRVETGTLRRRKSARYDSQTSRRRAKANLTDERIKGQLLWA